MTKLAENDMNSPHTEIRTPETGSEWLIRNAALAGFVLLLALSCVAVVTVVLELFRR